MSNPHHAALVRTGSVPSLHSEGPASRSLGNIVASTNVEAKYTRSLQILAGQANDLRDADQPIDRAWVNAATRLLVRLIADGDQAGVAAAQDTFRSLATAARRRRNEQAAAADVSPNPDSSDTPQDSSAEQLSVLVSMANAGTALIRPRDMGSQIGWGTLNGRLLLALTSTHPTPNEDLLTTLHTNRSQLSRACADLVKRGLITRRLNGKWASWVLSGAGVEAAAAVRRLNPSLRSDAEPVQQATAQDDTDTVWATTFPELGNAARRLAKRIAVVVPGDELACSEPAEQAAGADRALLWYERTEDVGNIDSDELEFRINPPDVLFLPDQEVAYVLQGGPSDRSLAASR